MLSISALRFPAVLLLPLFALLSGCGSSDLFSSDTKLFPSKMRFLSSDDWATATKNIAPDMAVVAPAAPEELVDGNGQCVAQAIAGASDVAVTTVAGDLGTSSAAPQPAPATVQGSIALGMTECQVATRAGQPAQVNISGDAANDRKAVLTYSSGPWPGIYTFSAGRLKEIERVAQPEPPKPAKKKGKAARPASASAPATQVVR